MTVDADHKKILSKHPLFNRLTGQEIGKLILLFTEKKYKAGDTIVVEGELVDSIYFIIKGKAEVKRKVIQNNEEKINPIAILNKGEAIGLDETGFFSKTGIRTATVVAVTAVTVLQLELNAFRNFMLEHPHVNEAMLNSAETMLRLNLIKRAAPFAKLSPDKLIWLNDQIIPLRVEEGEILFNKGDEGDQCFLIQEGKIEIFIPLENGAEEQVATLKSPQIFGESALLMNLPRNASARAIKPSQLLAIKRDVLMHVKTEDEVASALMLLQRSRSRPKRFPYIEMHFQEEDDKEPIITLKDPKHEEYFRLTQEGCFIWQLLDGKHTLREITLAFNKKYDVFDPGMIASFILDLEDAGFVEKELSHQEQKVEHSKIAKVFMSIRKVMEASAGFGNVDNWLTRSYRGGVYLLFTLPAQIIIAFIALVGLTIFIMNFSKYANLLHSTPSSNWLIIIAISATMFCIILHELAHAYTTKAFGHQVKSFGIGWFWLGPIAYCDTSDMWLSRKWPRIAVDLAGLYLDILLAAFAAIALLFVSNTYVALVLWLFALFNYLSVFVNLSPLIELDGYYTLMDISGRDNLRESAIVWLTEDFSKDWRHPKKLLQKKPEFFYWVACIIFLIFQLIVPYVIMKYLLYGMLGIQNPIYSLFFSLLVVTFSSLSIWAEIKHSTRKTA